jgi:hypothetical protein
MTRIWATPSSKSDSVRYLRPRTGLDGLLARAETTMKWYGVVAADSKYSPSMDAILPSVKCGRSSRASVVP